MATGGPPQGGTAQHRGAVRLDLTNERGRPVHQPLADGARRGNRHRGSVGARVVRGLAADVRRLEEKPRGCFVVRRLRERRLGKPSGTQRLIVRKRGSSRLEDGPGGGIPGRMHGAVILGEPRQSQRFFRIRCEVRRRAARGVDTQGLRCLGRGLTPAMVFQIRTRPGEMLADRTIARGSCRDLTQVRANLHLQTQGLGVGAIQN